MASTPTIQQQNIIDATEGYVRVAAVPGSGKTYCLTHRIAHLIQDLYISPDSIVALTFTRKAATSMRKKLRNIIGDAGSCFMGTFHHYCCTILKEEIQHLGYPKEFKSLTGNDQKKFIRDILKEMNLSARDYRTKDMLDMISQNKVGGGYVKLFETEPATFILEKYLNDAQRRHAVYEEIYYRYLLKQFSVHGLDYDDLIHFTIHIFSNHVDVLDKWQDKCEYVLVDEYQDVSQAQAKLADMLSNKYGNLFIIGDDDQLIYSWRGSKPEYLIGFDTTHYNTQSFTLDNNFRSTPEIIGVANELIQCNQERIPKRMTTANSSGIKPVYNCARTAKDEAKWICEMIQKAVETGIDYKEHTILIRSSLQSREIEQQLRLHSIPYKAYAGVAFFESEEVSTVLNYLSMILHMDDLSFENTIQMPKRGFGKTSMEKVRKYSEDNQMPMFFALMTMIQNGEIKNKEVFDYCKNIYTMHKQYQNYTCTQLANIVLDWGYRELLDGDPDQEKKDRVTQLLQMIYELEKEEDNAIPLSDMLQYFSLFTSGDDDTEDNKVKIMTIHASKGLEFDTVFIPGLVEGLIPSSKATTKRAMEEERRICYVAVTRAENKLYLSSYQYQYEKSNVPSMSSRFVEEMGEVNLDIIQKPVGRMAINAMNNVLPKKTAQFVVAQRISITNWGTGTIVEVDEINQKYKIVFDKCPQLPKNISFSADIKIVQ